MDIERLIEVSERGRKLYMLNDENLIELIKNENELQNYLSDSVDAIDTAIARQSATEIGETSDGYHTFNELYEHRTALMATICNIRSDISWKSMKHDDGTMYDGMFIVGIETPDGQYTYHCEMKYWYMFAMTKEIEKAPAYDGHQPSDYPRLLAYRKIHYIASRSRARKWQRRYRSFKADMEMCGSGRKNAEI